MAVKIKLARYGKIREPFYRVVVADARTRRSGRAIETIGRYNPKAEPSVIQIQSERAQYWLGVGAQPTAAVIALLKVTGDWQTFKDLPGKEGTLKPQPVPVDKKSRYEAAVAAAGGTTEDTSGATTPRKRAPRKADEAPAAETPAATAEPAGPAETTAAPAESAAAEPAVQSLVSAPAGDASDGAPFGPGSHAPLPDDAQPDGFPIKGNASSKLYHRPGTRFYDSTVAEVWFADEAAAEAAGFALPPSQAAEQAEDATE